MTYETVPGGTFGIEYDPFGRITELPSEFSGGGKLTTSYFVNDLTHSQTQDGITNTYELDAALRQRKRTRTGGTEEGTEIYHYTGGSDSPAWVDEGEGNWSRFIGGIGASAIEKSVTEDVVFQLADMHGDIVATADDSVEATELLSTQQFDEYGNPKQKLGLDLKLGWLGSKMRRTELPSGVIQMGVRSYVPAMGRFLSPDPVLGGSANAYEYAAGDPVNNFDLTGEKCVGSKAWIKRCKLRRAARRANKRRAITIKFKNRRAATRFFNYLKRNPLYVKRLERKVGRWRAEDVAEVRRRARAAAAEARALAPPEPIRCSDVATGLGATAVAGGAALAPVSFGASFVVGIGAGALGLIADGASRAGWC